MKQIEVNYKGLILSIDVTSYDAPRNPPYAPTPDHPGYDDEGSAGDVEFEVTSTSIDCEDTFVEAFGLDGDDDALTDLVFDAMEK